MARYTFILLACVLFIGHYSYVSASFIRSTNINDIDTKDINVPRDDNIDDDDTSSVEDHEIFPNLINRERIEIPNDISGDLFVVQQSEKECRKIGEFVSIY